MQTTVCLRKGDGYMDKSKTHILAFFTGHDAPEKKSVYVEMNGQGDELTRLVASVAIKMFSLGTTNKNIIQMRKQYLFDIINKWLDEDSVQDIELKEYSYEATGTGDVGGNAPSERKSCYEQEHCRTGREDEEQKFDRHRNNGRRREPGIYGRSSCGEHRCGRRQRQP